MNLNKFLGRLDEVGKKAGEQGGNSNSWEQWQKIWATRLKENGNDINDVTFFKSPDDDGLWNRESQKVKDFLKKMPGVIIKDSFKRVVLYKVGNVYGVPKGAKFFGKTKSITRKDASKKRRENNLMAAAHAKQKEGNYGITLWDDFKTKIDKKFFEDWDRVKLHDDEKYAGYWRSNNTPFIFIGLNSKIFNDCNDYMILR